VDVAGRGGRRRGAGSQAVGGLPRCRGTRRRGPVGVAAGVDRDADERVVAVDLERARGAGRRPGEAVEAEAAERGVGLELGSEDVDGAGEDRCRCRVSAAAAAVVGTGRDGGSTSGEALASCCCCFAPRLLRPDAWPPAALPRRGPPARRASRRGSAAGRPRSTGGTATPSRRPARRCARGRPRRASLASLLVPQRDRTLAGTNPSVRWSAAQDPASTQTPMAALPAARVLRWSWSLSSTLNQVTGRWTRVMPRPR
jgi:hypothetical protein